MILSYMLYHESPEKVYMDIINSDEIKDAGNFKLGILRG